MENYHTHTFRCRHAKGHDRDYVQKAIDEGFSLLGFSDHTPWPLDYDGEIRRQRMRPEQLDDYVTSIRSLKEEFSGRIDIALGLEVEAFIPLYGWLREMVDKYGIEYLILGNHYPCYDEIGFIGFSCTVEGMRFVVDTTEKALDTGLFKYMAHPDLMFNNYPVFDQDCRRASHDICALAKEHNLPLEYNLYGELKKERGKSSGIGYPAPPFWEIAADYGIDAYIGIDAHNPEHISSERFRRAAEHLRSMGIKVLNC